MANNIIKGRKGGSSSQRTPTEQPDDLQSVAKAKILIALGEGEFAGGLTGKDIYLDGTPLENADGSQNFSGVAWEFRPGTQAQSYIQGIPGTENEISVGTEVSSQTAWTHTFTNTQLSAVRVRLKWPSLMKQEDDGDVVGNTVKYAIDLQTDGGAWQTVLETAVSGKTTSGYERSHRIDLPQAGSTWTLRLRKISPDANSVKIGDVMTLQSYTEVIDAKLRYPHTALLYIEFDSSQFNGSIPQISCEPRGRVIRVPDNYNPETREYTGTWTGGFKWAWTDNPAWIYYDIVVSDRFGLGDRLTSANISKWALYPIAQYCDQLVPDGRGGDGMEPRYICNVYVQERNDAYTVLRDFAAIFRGMTCWSGEQIIVQADMPRDVDFNYTRANILGSPRYSSSTSKARYTNALVSWSDPDNAYADAMEPAFIPELVSRYSFNQLEVTAIGCTRQSEAHRKGLWGILTNNKDRMVEIDVGLDGRIPQPGYIIGLGDERLAGRVNGGRISAVNGRVITLDRDIDAKEGDRLHLNLPSGISQARTIQSVNGRRQVTVTTAYSETPEAECVWIVEYTDLVPQQYRVIGVKDNNNGTLTITGVAHDPDKFPRIDTGAIIDQRPVSVLPAGNQSPPDDIVITSRSVVNQGISVETMQVNWSAVSGAISYEAQWRRNEGNWISVPRNSTTSFEVSGIYAGRYLVRVRAIKDYVPSSDMTLAFSINWILNSGEIYFDDVLFVDVTDEINNAANASAISGLTTRVTAAEGKISTNSQSITQLKGDVSTLQGQIANKADASALQQLQTTVIQQGDKLASQGSAITELQNTAQNGKAKYWLTKIFDIKVSGSGYIPKLSDLSGVPPLAVSEMADAAKLDFQSYGDYKIAYAKSLVYLNADKTIEIAPGSRIVDDTGRLYVNSVETASLGASTTKYSLALKKGWNTIEFVVAQMTGGFYINFGLKLSDNVDQLFSGAGQMAAASAAQVISSQVEQTAGKVDANSSAILTLNNSVKDINTALNNKADASALQSLTTRVSNAEGKITSQGNAITQLTNDLSTANGKITANTGAISSLTSRVTAAEGKIDSQAESITSINSSIKGILTQAANLIPNPTVDPAYPQMGMTVVSTTSEGVPAGCPYAWAIKCQYRDHVPVMNNIPCHEGQVFEISVLAACGTGTAPFQHYIGTSTQAAGSIGSPQANGGQISAATGAQWTRTTWRFKPNATHAAKGYFRPFLQINQSGPDFGTVWYATDWQVRDVTAAANAEGKADANATAISQLTTRVTNAEGQITSQGQAITKLTSDLSTLTGVVNSKADASALNSLTTRVSNAEGKIASQGQSITQLTNSISNTESAMDAQGKIPGNLLANASFERGQVAFDGWSDLTDVIDATNPHSGGKILRMNAGAGVKIGQSIEVTQGRRYRFGVFARQNAGTEIQDPANTKFRIADGSDNLLAAVNYGPFTNTWQHVSMDWTASKNTVAKFQLTAFLKTGSMYFDDVYVVDITNETNIKGNADAITSLNTKVTQQGNDITSQSNAITNLTNRLKTQQYSNSNPWVDGSFESYADGQTIGGANAAVTTEYAFSGSKSLKCRRADGETGNSDKMFGYETTIREDAVYRYECWAMMPEGETPPNGWGCNVGMIVRTAAGTAAWPTAFAINEAALTAGGGRGKWVKFSGKLSAGGSQKTRGRLWISTRGTAGGPGYRLYIDDLVITDVTDAHAAQTTADANSSAISGLTSRVTSAEGKITAQADSITKLTGEINTINGTLSQKADASAVNALQSRVTTAEGKIESQGTAITQLTNGLEAYRRTGENLVQNFDFLQGDTAYNVQNASKVTFGDYGDGKVGVRMVRTDGNSPGIFANNKKPIPQNGQRRYRYVVRAKGVSGAMNLLMRRWNFNGTVEGPGVDKNFTLTTSWQTLTWETDLTPATGVDGSAFGLYCHPSNAEIWIDSFKVYDITEEVTIKANSDALSTLTSTVTQNGKDIAAQANALTQLKSSLTNDAVALATNPNNMVANSGFERGTDNWSGFNAYADIYAAQSPRTGAYIMRGLSGGNVAVSQVILGIKKGRTYRYGGYMRRDSNTTIGNQGNNKFRIGNADTGAGPIHQVEYSQSNVGTSWTLITGDWVPASDQNIAFSINVLLTAGNFYFDDIFFVDVTDEINNAANATAITNLTTRVTLAEGKITSQGTAITQLTADLSTANGKITANANAITSLQSTVTQQGNTLTTQGQAITKLNSDLSDLSGVVDTKASASAVSQLTTRVTNAEGKITANSTALNSITSRVNDAESAIDGLNETTAANGLAMANGFQQLRAQIGDNQAAITQTNKAVVDLESATAQQIDTINASMDGMSATVQQTSTAVADINGKLSAQWGVKVQTDTGGGNPRIAGIQLGIDASGSSQFLVMADTFAVYTGGTNKTYPFVVQNGVAYMQEALIRDGSITNAKIGNEIKSNNFVEGSSGWRIGKDGSSQFNNVIVRGAVYATDGWFQGTVYANRIEGDIGSFAINIAQHRTRKVPKATWQWFELARFRRQNFDQVINIRGGLLQTDSITIDGGAKLRAGMSYSPGSDGGLDPGFLSYAMLLRGTGATSGGGSMEIGVELAYETGGATRLLTAQESMNVENMSFVVPAGTGDAILRYGCYLDRNGQMVLTILSRFDAFSARNNNVIRGSSTP
ncbi:TPA: DUF1983 domain-containing protein [Klebsiella pneumoniae]|nr:DUF1983 domain-containing protein [Klebsiella pneumoniae]